MTCRCQNGRVIAMVRYAKGGCRMESTPCPTCHGTGEDPRHPDDVAVGEVFRTERVAKGLSLREVAAALGVKPSTLSDVEFGRVVMPDDWMAALQAMPPQA